MTSSEHTVGIGALRLDSGVTLPDVQQRVTIYSCGASTSTVLVAHALTGSSRAQEWWPGMIGEGKFFDPARWRVIGMNVLGGCYGSTPVRESRVTVRDIVRAEQRALAQLGIEHVDMVIGGSLGGMQALQWAVDFPKQVGTAVVIGAHDHHSAMGIALNALQREAIEIDPARGLRLARKIAMLTYKSEGLFAQRHGRKPDRYGHERFDVEGYLEYQADVFETRMDPQTYALLTHAMDSFDVRDAPVPLGPELRFIGISSDWLFRPQDVRAAAVRFASLGARATYAELRSDHGHDAFLAEPDALGKLLAIVPASGTT